MKMEEITVKNVEYFILENVFSNVNFRQNEKYYKDKSVVELKEMFKFEVRYKQSKTHNYLTVRVCLRLIDIDELSHYSACCLFSDFMNIFDLENISSSDVSLGFYASQDFEFELELTLWETVK